MKTLADVAHTRLMAITHRLSHNGLDLVQIADRRTSVADASTAYLLARGYHPDDITSTGLRIDRAAYEDVRASWVRLLREDPTDWAIRNAKEVRDLWLSLRPEWDDDWGIPIQQ